MRKGPSNATKWFYWFSLGVALLIAHAILSNVAGIYSFASRIALVLMPFFLAITIRIRLPIISIFSYINYFPIINVSSNRFCAH